ncbi:hypothetical protein NHQ30_010377 [Ciborinia camelliae]|nr:hypothetical protein NHQ30_010377 [Ciborinia camelliae]
MSLETAEESIARYEETMSHQSDRGPGPHPAQRSTSLSDQSLNDNNFLSNNNDLVGLYDFNLDDYDLSTPYNSELELEDINQFGPGFGTQTLFPSMVAIPSPPIVASRRSSSQPTEMPPVTQTPLESNTVSESQVFHNLRRKDCQTPVSESNVSTSIEGLSLVALPRRSNRNKQWSSVRGNESIMTPNRTPNIPNTTLASGGLIPDQVDHPISLRSSISVSGTSTISDIRSNQLHNICKELQEFENKDLSEQFVASKMTGIIQAFYRHTADGPDTIQLEVLVKSSILGVIRNDALTWKDMKPMKSAEEVLKIYREAGWVFHVSQNYPSSGHLMASTSSVSSQQMDRSGSVCSRSSKRRSDFESSMDTASLSSKRVKPSSNKYKCYYNYCSKSFDTLKSLKRHTDIHNPCQFTACIMPGCKYITLRKDSVENHLASRHRNEFNGLSENEKRKKRKDMRNNTFVIGDRTHDHCVFCAKELPRGSWENSRKSQAHIKSHLGNPTTTSVFQHLCSDKDQCGKNECWESSWYVRPENRQRVPTNDGDDSDSDSLLEIGVNDGYFNNGNTPEQQKRPNANLSFPTPSYYGSNFSFSGDNYPTNSDQPSYRSPYPVLGYLGENPDSEVFNSYTMPNRSDESSRIDALASSVAIYDKTIHPSQREGTTTTDRLQFNDGSQL